MNYRPEIDGMRTIAVSTVVLYHAGLGSLSGGFVGVDMFFVISGFLITSILVRDLEKGRFSLALFYERRCRRILPPLAVMALVTLVWAWFTFLPDDFMTFGRSLAAMALFWSNIFFYKSTGYFDPIAETMPLLHTWSLAVEEQFYIIYPILLFILYKKVKTKPLPVLATIAALSLAAGAWMLHTGQNNKAVFYLLHFRAWELLMGGLVALMPVCPNLGRIKMTALGLLGLGLLGLGLFVVPSLPHAIVTFAPGLAPLPACLGIALLIYIHGSGTKNSPVGWLLSTRPFTGVGKISYALYLWHWPLLVLPALNKEAPLTGGEALGLMTLAVILSALSYFFIEQPVRQKRFPQTRRGVFIASLCVIFTLMACGRTIRHADGFRFRVPERARMYEATLRDQDHDLPQYDARLSRYNPMPPYHVGPPEARPAFILWGDSHAGAWTPAARALAEQYGLGGLVMSCSACPPLVGFDSRHEALCLGFNNYVLDVIEEHGIRHVIMSSYLLFYVQDLATAGNPEAGEETVKSYLIKTIDGLRQTGATVWLIRPTPIFPYSVPRKMIKDALEYKPASEADLPLADYRPLDYLYEAAAEHGAVILPFVPDVCNDQVCPTTDADGVFYRDTNHLSVYGALHFKNTLRPVMEAVGLTTGEQ
ncbi:acyltransferase [Deltaproteobacteria bacterium OttesenSCG-928-M10]|nr:acyltransferase [Deltaproteobacteria bacterium OttesenSCG-928-M10]